jgi:perosamine synthetase
LQKWRRERRRLGRPNGGTMKRIPITKPVFDESDFESIVKPLKSGWVVQGPFVRDFEQQFAAFTGAEYAVATSSCTTAQLISSLCIDIKPGDEVLVPSFTWISTANSVEFLGAKPVFVDIDLKTFTIDGNKIDEKITPRTKAIYPVNLFGLTADYDTITDIAATQRLTVVEDCACSLGSYFQPEGSPMPIHSGNLGIIGNFSLHPRKSITTGEGGMLITNDEHIAELARSLRDHGATRSDVERHDSKTGFLLPEYPYLGYNFRMTDIQGALGCAQMGKLPWILEARMAKARRYDELLDHEPFLLKPHIPGNAVHSYQSYVCLYRPDIIEDILESGRDMVARIDVLSEERNKFMLGLEERGVSTRQGTHCVTIQTYYAQKYNLRPEDFIHGYIADRCTLTLPLYVTMTDDDQRYVVEQVREEFKG